MFHTFMKIVQSIKKQKTLKMNEEWNEDYNMPFNPSNHNAGPDSPDTSARI